MCMCTMCHRPFNKWLAESWFLFSKYSLDLHVTALMSPGDSVKVMMLCVNHISDYSDVDDNICNVMCRLLSTKETRPHPQQWKTPSSNLKQMTTFNPSQTILPSSSEAFYHMTTTF